MQYSSPPAYIIRLGLLSSQSQAEIISTILTAKSIPTALYSCVHQLRAAIFFPGVTRMAKYM